MTLSSNQQQQPATNYNQALFRANPQLLKSPLPYHVLLKQKQQAEAGFSGSSVDGGGSLFKPRPIYAQLNPYDGADQSPNATATTFKVPFSPHSNNSIQQPITNSSPAFNPKVYLEKQRHSSPAPIQQRQSSSPIHKSNSPLHPSQQLRSVDDELDELVNSIHSEAVSKTPSRSAVTAKNVTVAAVKSSPPRKHSSEGSSGKHVRELEIDDILDTEKFINDQSGKKKLTEKSPTKAGKIDYHHGNSNSLEEKKEELISDVEIVVPPKNQVKRHKKSRKNATVVEPSNIVKEDAQNIHDNPPVLPKLSHLPKYFENFPGVHFEIWWPRLVSLQSSGYQIVIEGFRRTTKGLKPWHSSVIRDVKGRKCVVSHSGTVYWLHGECQVKKCAKEYREILAEKMIDGFFDGWKSYLLDIDLDTSGKELFVKKTETLNVEIPIEKENPKKKLKRADEANFPVLQIQEPSVDQDEEMDKEIEANHDAIEDENKQVQEDDHEEIFTKTKRYSDVFADDGKNKTDKEKRRHTLVALSTKRREVLVTRSRSGRKIKPPTDYWNATEAIQKQEEDFSAPLIKFEWGTGKVKVLRKGESAPNSASKVRKSRIYVEDEHGKEDDDSSSENVSPDKNAEKMIRKKRKRERREEDKEELKRELYRSEIQEDESNDEFGKDSPLSVSWTKQEDRILEKSIWEHDPKDPKYWSLISLNLPGKSARACQTRYQSGFGKRLSMGEKQRPTKNSMPFNGKLAGNKTLLRKKQIRQLNFERMERHEDDFFGNDDDNDDDDQEEQKLKKKDYEEGDRDTPEILRSFDRDKHDAYIEAMKRRKTVKTSSNIKKKEEKKVRMRPVVELSKYQKKLLIPETSEDDTDQDEEVDDSRMDGKVLDLYADDSN